jgi:hypothetical protein
MLLKRSGKASRRISFLVALRVVRCLHHPHPVIQSEGLRYFAPQPKSLSRSLKRAFVVAFIVRAKARTYLKSNGNSNGEEADPLRG